MRASLTRYRALIVVGVLALIFVAALASGFLVGLINWTDSWFNPSGQISQAQLAEMLTQHFLYGFNSVEQERAVCEADH